MNRTTSTQRILVGCLLLASVIASLAVVVNLQQFMPSPRSTEVCTVTEKLRTDLPEQGVALRVETAECGAFQIGGTGHLTPTDAISLYGAFDVGSAYRLETRGKSIPIFGVDPTVVGAAEVCVQTGDRCTL